MDTYNSHLVVSVSSDTNGVFFSVDNGDNWQLSSNMHATLVDFVFDNDTILYGIFPGESWSSGLWKSHDFGDTWENEFYSTKMEALGFTGNTIFVGWYQSESTYEKGVAIWDKYQNELTFLYEGLPNTNIRNIVENQFFDCDNITVCTDSGAYCLTEFSVRIKEEIFVPDNFKISNYPNPFNPVTIITYDLPEQIHVTINIYDLMGREKATLVNGMIPAGIHKVVWYANEVSSGIYIVKLTTSKDSIIKKILTQKISVIK